MDWLDILERCRRIKSEFDKTYKCLNIDRPIKEDTVNKHYKKLIQYLEEIRVLLNVNYHRLTPAHKIAAEAFFQDIKNRLIQIAEKGLLKYIYHKHCMKR